MSVDYSYNDLLRKLEENLFVNVNCLGSWTVANAVGQCDILNNIVLWTKTKHLCLVWCSLSCHVSISSCCDVSASICGRKYVVLVKLSSFIFLYCTYDFAVEYRMQSCCSFQPYIGDVYLFL